MMLLILLSPFHILLFPSGSGVWGVLSLLCEHTTVWMEGYLRRSREMANSILLITSLLPLMTCGHDDIVWIQLSAVVIPAVIIVSARR
ncbi:uncharacterized protein F5Z01DRAFT_664490 [Emericellopsis atlantica]|uniref:Secreted peptide n=1 Tax=Emericellopsis atlantica TaxID=2614577 RepID=A0A9P7ZFM0_9HYPO|nr:uncharacterized protein F5Z01DRAFT_664490 [Emericellopsis atlantica]KAG9251051.1 hypothetical protein F5Z01DRAFT_664490 [Emericellopsis atlantica]